MQILFEDAHIVVCIKPYGIVSQSSKDGRDMVSELSRMLGCEIYPVHRLDRETGGVMVYAKTGTAAAKLCTDVAQRRLQKTYLAIVHGAFPEKAGELCDLLFRDQKRNKSFVVTRQRKGVKQAVLQYETLQTTVSPFGELTLLRIRLITGRTHQIRVQFSSRKFPLLGDGRYGAADAAGKMGLWSYAISFAHPVTGERLQFSAAPQDNDGFDCFSVEY